MSHQSNRNQHGTDSETLNNNNISLSLPLPRQSTHLSVSIRRMLTSSRILLDLPLLLPADASSLSPGSSSRRRLLRPPPPPPRPRDRGLLPRRPPPPRPLPDAVLRDDDPRPPPPPPLVLVLLELLLLLLLLSPPPRLLPRCSPDIGASIRTAQSQSIVKYCIQSRSVMLMLLGYGVYIAQRSNVPFYICS